MNNQQKVILGVVSAVLVGLGGMMIVTPPPPTGKAQKINEQSPQKRARKAIKQFKNYKTEISNAKKKDKTSQNVCIVGENLNYAYYGIYDELARNYMTLIVGSGVKELAQTMCQIDIEKVSSTIYENSKYFQNDIQRSEIWSLNDGEVISKNEITSLIGAGAVGCDDFVTYVANTLSQAEIGNMIESCRVAGKNGVTSGSRSSDRLERYITENMKNCKLLYKTQNRLKQVVCSNAADSCQFDKTRQFCSQNK